MSKGFKVVVGGVVALVVLFGVAFTALPAAQASGGIGNRVTRAANQVVQVVTGQSVTTTRFQAGVPAFAGPGFGGHHDGGGLAVDETYLADALGITVEELQAAKEEALSAALDQAVEDGIITQEQADEILLNGGGRGFRHLGQSIDQQSYLADALGISVEELEAAKAEAQEAAISAALEAGTITQEQADYLNARNAVRANIDQKAIAADVLGVTVEELDAARSEGTSMATLLEEAGLTVDEYRTAVSDAYQAAVQGLVDDGTITQEQADLLQSNGEGLGFGPGFAGGHGFGGRGFGGPGFGGNCPADGSQPQDSESTTPTVDA